MKWLNKIHLSTRITLSFGASVVVLVAAAVFFSANLRRLASDTTPTLNSAAANSGDAGDLCALSMKAGYEEKCMLYGAASAEDAANASIGFDHRLNSLLEQTSGYDRDTLEAIAAAWTELKKIETGASPSMRYRNPAAFQSTTRQLEAGFSGMQARIAGLVVRNSERIKGTGSRIIGEQKALGSELWAIISLLVLVTVGTGVAWYRSLTAPLNALTAVVRDVSAGKWGTQAKVRAGAEFGALIRAFNAMSEDIARLAAYINQVGNPVYAVDKSFTIQFANAAALEAADGTYQDIVEKKKCFDVFKLPACRTGDCPVSRAWNEQRLIAGESSALLRGRRLPVLYQAASVKDVFGQVTRGVEVITDVSKIKEITDAVEKQRGYLSESINTLLASMEKFAAGDLTAKLEATRQDEIGSLFNGFNKAVENFRELIKEVIQTAHSVNNASLEISGSTEELAAGAQQQSAQAGEVAAAMEQMTGTVVRNSQNAARVAETANENGKVARNGGEVVQSTVSKMKEIAEVVQQSSDTVNRLGKLSGQIGEIVSVIDDIADQTNLLALNAAIEAARAGDEGRGFAVVADEVRKLAERTTEATKQISAMIKDIQRSTGEAVTAIEHGNKEVSEGIQLADRAGDSLGNVVRNAQEIVGAISLMAAANQEQSAASEQVSRNILAISKVSSESAEGIGRIARSAEDLNMLTDSLMKLTMRFRIGRDESVTLRPPRKQEA